ncbi:MAG: amylo-alpha-1,6-glucosidase [Lachnospiraceae bacterium]
MTVYRYEKQDFTPFNKAIRQEWTMTNGIGGYAGRSLIDSQNRTHQGYLIASLHPPIERYLVFSHVTEQFQTRKNTISLETAQFRKNGQIIDAQGQQYLQEMKYDGTVFYRYATDSFVLEKQIALKRGENTCAVSYHIKNLLPDEQTMILTPYFNFREHNTNSVPEDFSFRETVASHTLTLTPKLFPAHTIVFRFSSGSLLKRENTVRDHFSLQTEVELETEGLDSHYCPYDLSLLLAPFEEKELSLLCSVVSSDNCDSFESLPSDAAWHICHDTQHYYETCIDRAGYHDSLADKLVLAANHFLAYRKSTGYTTVLAGLPWFTDWGRDTMIAYTGLSLCTHRFDDAKEILLTFARYLKNGIVPNMFPDDNASPLYNTADASLWYFYAVERYLHYVNSDEAFSFVKQEIYPCLKEILSAYENGTDFEIYMDTDGLIHAGSGLDQITWMDVRVGDWVATPRHGKPVEINALWYNALRVTEFLAKKFGEDASHYQELSELVKTSFCKKFWNEKSGCLYDVVDVSETRSDPLGICDDKIRPNQIYAVSLPYTMLSPDQEQSVTDVVKEVLYVGCGLRSLAPDDPEYHGIYCGALPKRDAAYHQGTAWGFLLGGFLTAYRKVHHHDEESKKRALAMLEPVISHLHHTGCIGSISEIFDGDAPHTPRGCYAQAWSVGEVLRAYVEDIF